MPFKADAHGCPLDRGERWCAVTKSCIHEYDQCSPGAWDTGACTYSWAGLSWDLSALRRASHYVIEDVNMQDVTTDYVVGICADVDPASADAACAATTGSARESMHEGAPAYQVMRSTQDMPVAGGGAVVGGVGRFTDGVFLDESPSLGPRRSRPRP